MKFRATRLTAHTLDSPDSENKSEDVVDVVCGLGEAWGFIFDVLMSGSVSFLCGLLLTPVQYACHIA